ncbi:MAG: hypothetical protein AB7F32_08115, partial [Victivallaceae bacterium]
NLPSPNCKKNFFLSRPAHRYRMPLFAPLPVGDLFNFEKLSIFFGKALTKLKIFATIINRFTNDV